MKKNPLLLVEVVLIPSLGLLQGAETPEKETKLEFRLVVDQPVPETEALPLKEKSGSLENPKTLITRKAADFGREDLKSVKTVISKNVTVDPSGKESSTESNDIAVTLIKAAGIRMEEWSKDHLGKRVAIVLDGQILLAPTIQSPLGAQFHITGNYSASEAKAIVEKLTPKKMSLPKPPQ